MYPCDLVKRFSYASSMMTRGPGSVPRILQQVGIPDPGYGQGRSGGEEGGDSRETLRNMQRGAALLAVLLLLVYPEVSLSFSPSMLAGLRRPRPRVAGTAAAFHHLSAAHLRRDRARRQPIPVSMSLAVASGSDVGAAPPVGEELDELLEPLEPISRAYKKFDRAEDVEGQQDDEDAAVVDMDETMHSGANALRHLYHKSERVLVVQFVKDKCSMCKVFKPILERVVKEYKEANTMHFVELEVTKNKDIVKQAGLKAVPVSLIFKSGLLVGEINGLLSKKSLRGKFDSMIAAYSGMDTADIAARQVIRSRNGASASGQGDLRDAVCTFKPKLFFPGRTFYPSRWNSDFTGEAEGKRKGLVWEIGTMTSAASEDDEFDKGFIQALIQSNTPSFVRDEDGNLVRTAGSIPKKKAMTGRIADGESNLEYGRPQGVAQESDECDGAGCFKVSCEGGAECDGEDAMTQDR